MTASRPLLRLIVDHGPADCEATLETWHADARRPDCAFPGRTATAPATDHLGQLGGDRDHGWYRHGLLRCRSNRRPLGSVTSGIEVR